MRRTHDLGGWAALLMVGASVALAASLWDLLPPNRALDGWGILPGAEKKTASASGLYSMYDGAAPEMMHAGIVAAGQRVYQRGARRLTVDVFRFSNPAPANTYYAARQREIASVKGFTKLSGVGQGACVARTCKSAVLYLWSRNYCCSLAVNGNSATDQAALTAFARYIAARLAASR